MSHIRSNPVDAAVKKLFALVSQDYQSEAHSNQWADQAEACIKTLQQHAALEREDENGLTFFAWACKQGHIQIAWALLKAGADVNKISKNDYQTPLLRAIDAQNIAVVNFLINAGADPNQEGLKTNESVGQTPLLLAVQKGNIDIVQALLLANADPDKENYTGTALEMAIYHSPEMVQVLLHAGANPYKRKKHYSPLIAAVKEGLAPIVQLLLQEGVEPNERCIDLQTLKALEGGHKVDPYKVEEQTALDCAIQMVLKPKRYEKHISFETLREIINLLWEHKSRIHRPEKLAQLLNDFPEDHEAIILFREFLVQQQAERCKQKSPSQPHRYPLENLVPFRELLEKLTKMLDVLQKKSLRNKAYVPLCREVSTLKTLLESQQKLSTLPNPAAHEIRRFRFLGEQALRIANLAEKEAKNHRGWHLIHPVLRGLVGILAGFTIFPGIVVSYKSHHGFIQTFFKKPEPRTAEKMTAVRQTLQRLGG